MRRHLEALRWPLLVAAVAAAPLALVLATGHTLAWRDTAQLYAPHRAAVAEALRSLRLPAWNPWEATGQPLLAQGLDSVLHPLSLALAPFTSSIDALVVAAIAFAALGTWAAARQLGMSPSASAGAAFAFALSGYVLAMAANAVFLLGSASAPWAVAGWVAAARHRRGWLAAAAGIATLTLSGDAGSLLAACLAGAALARAVGGWRGLARGVAGAALGVALAAVQLVPSLAYLAETTRGAGLLDPGAARRWALAPWRVLELLAPGFFVGIPRSYSAPVFAALGGGGPDRFPFAASVFVGAPVVLLAAAAARRNALARWLLALSAAFLWLALGHHVGSQQLLSVVPVWGALRYWEKMVGPLTLCLALGAGLGVDALRDGTVRALGRTALAAAAAAVLVGLALPAALAPGEVAEIAGAQLRTGAAHAAVALLALGAAALVGRRWPRAAAPAAAAVLLLESAAASPFALHAGSPRTLEARPPPLEAPAPGPRMVSPLGYDFARGSGGLDAIDRLQLWEGRAGRPSTNVAARVDSIATYTGLTSTRWEMIIGAGELFWPLARRFGTTHVLSRPPASDAEADALRAATAGATRATSWEGGQLRVWEVPHRPWASFAPAVRAAPDREAAAAMLGEEIVSGRATVVVETTAAPPVSDGRVLRVSRAAEEVVVEAESTADALLVVNDAFAAGWTATIDGREAEILPADVLVRAVRWPAGRHRLVMRYVPRGLAAGLAITCAAFAAAALAWLRSRSSAAP